MSTNYYVTHVSYEKGVVPYDWLNKVHLSKNSGGGHNFQAVLSQNDTGRYKHNPDFNHQNPNTVVDYWDPSNQLSGTIETWGQWKAEILRDDLCIIDEYGMVQDKDEYIRQVEGMEDRSRPFNNFSGPNDHIRQYYDPQGYCFTAWPFF